MTRHDQERRERSDPEDGRVIGLEGAFVEQLSDPRPAEDDLNDQAAAHQRGQLEPDQPDQRDDLISQRVEVDDAPSAHPYRAGMSHVVLRKPLPPPRSTTPTPDGPYNHMKDATL